MEYKELESLVISTIDKEKQKAFELNEYIFDNPELPHKEYLACAKYVELLTKEGIKVEDKFLGIETAFKATIHEDPSSDIKIGILAEYDALPEIGHACGHSASGALSFLAALSLFKNKEKLKGNIYLIGTPAEEGNSAAKKVMADANLFDDFSYVIMIHMYDKNQTHSMFMALDTFTFEFYGKPSHAAASPWEGKNAVNGMTLFIHALDMMRQQLRDGSRIHGRILSGGTATNVIPEYASCMYTFRYKKADYLGEIIRMGRDAAQGCAKATQTTVKISDSLAGYDDMILIPSADYLIESIYEELGVELSKEPVAPLGSSDIGNVSYRCPTLHPLISITDKPMALHTKEFADCVKTDKAKWAIEKGAKTIASFVVRSLFDETIIENMKKDFAGQ
ncbi:MAG: amidohydrolase [Sedimentibacter sp.]